MDLKNSMNYVAGGKLGDFIHTLSVIKLFYDKTGEKGNLYLTDDRSYGGDDFSLNMNTTYQDLLEIVIVQEYIDNFEILKEPISNYINLNDWRNTRISINATGPINWSHLLNVTYNCGQINGEWIKIKDRNSKFNNKVVICRSKTKSRWNPYFPWNEIIKNNDCVFVSQDVEEYLRFPYKVDFYKPKSLYEFFTIISSCKIFVGNQSTPFAIANSVNVPKLCELSLQDIEQYSYIGEEKVFKDFYWISNAVNNPENYYYHNTGSYLNGIEKYIKIK